MSTSGGGEYGRWFAISLGGLAALGALLSIPAYPALLGSKGTEGTVSLIGLTLVVEQNRLVWVSC